MLILDYFLSKSKKELSATTLYYSKTLKYTQYFLYITIRIKKP